MLWANPSRIYPARVREIAPAVDPATRTFAVRVAIVAPDSGAAMGHDGERRCCAAKPNDGAALLPLTALYQRDGKPGGVGLRSRRRRR